MADVEVKEGRRIIVAVDGGEESLYALSWCLKNVVSDNSRDTLVLLYARTPRVLYASLDGAGYMFSSEIMATMEKHSKEVADSVIEKAKRICADDLHNVKVEVKVDDGDSRDVICEAVEMLGADMLVLGSHGYGLFKRAFLGSVSNHCAQNVKCPVLIVKRPKN